MSIIKLTDDDFSNSFYGGKGKNKGGLSMIKECKFELLPEDLQNEIKMYKKSIDEKEGNDDCWSAEIYGTTNQYYACKVISEDVRNWIFNTIVFGRNFYGLF